MLYAILILPEVYSTTMRGIRSLPCLPPMMRGEILKVPDFPQHFLFKIFNIGYFMYKGPSFTVIASE
jgi:hypothetical protein